MANITMKMVLSVEGSIVKRNAFKIKSSISHSPLPNHLTI
jgi:hypothetical protein